MQRLREREKEMEMYLCSLHNMFSHATEKCALC